MGGTEGTADQETCAEIDFIINKMLSCHIPMENLRAEMEIFKGGNITNCVKNWQILYKICFF